MPSKAPSQLPSAKPSERKSGASSIRNIMDDAPLFAGLDDFILQPAAKKNSGAAETGDKKRKTTPKLTGKQQAGPSKPQQREKTKKLPSSPADALLLSVAEMCTLLKISRATLVRMDKSGQLPGRIKLGGSVRFHRRTVESWLQSLITPPVP